MIATCCEDNAGNVYTIDADGALEPLWPRPLAERRAISAQQTQAVYDYIVRYKRINDGVAPAIRDIQTACGISSTSVVAWHLDKLVAQRRIRRGPGGRNLRVVGGAWIAPEGVHA